MLHGRLLVKNKGWDPRAQQAVMCWRELTMHGLAAGF